MFKEVYLVDKPQEWTSFDVVAKIRSTLSQRYRHLEGEKRRFKVGHSGTLDPLATGLLLVAAGKATPELTDYLKLDKTYQVEAKLGFTSTTGDEEGEKTAVNELLKPSRQDVESVLRGFMGKQQQTPPQYSAIKIGGKKAYEYARAGKEVAIEPRDVEIYVIDNVSYEYPFVRFTARVSSGTYIRSLVEDVGSKLETGAYMSALRRTAIGEHSVGDASPIEDIVESISNYSVAKFS